MPANGVFDQPTGPLKQQDKGGGWTITEEKMLLSNPFYALICWYCSPDKAAKAFIGLDNNMRATLLIAKSKWCVSISGKKPKIS